MVYIQKDDVYDDKAVYTDIKIREVFENNDVFSGRKGYRIPYKLCMKIVEEYGVTKQDHLGDLITCIFIIGLIVFGATNLWWQISNETSQCKSGFYIVGFMGIQCADQVDKNIKK